MAFAELSGMLLADGPVEATLLRVAQAVKECVDGVGDVSVSIIDDRGARTVVFTGAPAIQLDEVQYELGSGPCLDAARTQRTVVVNTRVQTGYPRFCEQAYSQGVRHTLSIGLPTPNGSAAGLNIYGTAPESFDPSALSLATSFANYASVAVSRAAGTADTADAPPGWLAAVSSRARVDEAVLAVMRGRGCNREEALSELLGRARSLGRPLAEVARTTVGG